MVRPTDSARWSGAILRSRMDSNFTMALGPRDFTTTTRSWRKRCNGSPIRLKKGFIVPAKDARQLGANSFFAAGKGAMALTGSWMINWYVDNAKFDKGFAPLPKGPNGRKSMFNGLADSIWVGSKHKDEAWKWVKFLGSEEGQKIIAGYGVVFPAVQAAAQEGRGSHEQKGSGCLAFPSGSN